MICVYGEYGCTTMGCRCFVTPSSAATLVGLGVAELSDRAALTLGSMGALPALREKGGMSLLAHMDVRVSGSVHVLKNPLSEVVMISQCPHLLQTSKVRRE